MRAKFITGSYPGHDWSSDRGGSMARTYPSCCCCCIELRVCCCSLKVPLVRNIHTKKYICIYIKRQNTGVYRTTKGRSSVVRFPLFTPLLPPSSAPQRTRARVNHAYRFFFLFYYNSVQFGPKYKTESLQTTLTALQKLREGAEYSCVVMWWWWEWWWWWWY